MNDEYVRVVFPERRDVWVDDVITAFTNETFQVEGGWHVFHLGSPKNYTPDQMEIAVVDTLAEKPLVIRFKSTAG